MDKQQLIESFRDLSPEDRYEVLAAILTDENILDDSAHRDAVQEAHDRLAAHQRGELQWLTTRELRQRLGL